MPREFLETVYTKTRGVLLEPSKFFKSAKKEKGLDDALKYLAAVSLITSFFTSVNLSTRLGVTPFISTFIGLYLFILVALLLTAVAVQLFALILDGDGSYNDTFRALAYGYTPTALFGWIQPVGGIAGLYSTWLYIKGMSVMHNVSMWRATAMVLLPAVALLVVIITAIFAFSATLAAMGTGLGEIGSAQVANLL